MPAAPGIHPSQFDARAFTRNSIRLFLRVALVRPGLAQNQETVASLVLACDRAAASPSDTNRPVGVAGVPSGRLDSQIAIAACEAAAAAPDDPRIMFQLGGAQAAAKADESARGYFSKASDLGYAPSQASLGAFYAAGRGGLAQDDREALRLVKLAAEQGDPLGNNNLGFFYESGRGGLPKDDREAARLYQFAVDNGDSWGQYNLGRLYQNGRGGLTQNDREAARLYSLAADQGHEFAEASLGFFYETGRGGLASPGRRHDISINSISAAHSSPPTSATRTRGAPMRARAAGSSPGAAAAAWR
jgi:TPR repeat protein